MTTRVVIELDEQVAERLQAAATKARTTAEALAADVVGRGVAEIEAWAEDEAAFAEYQQTGEAIPLAAMEDWVRSWGSPDELPPPEPCKSSS